MIGGIIWVLVLFMIVPDGFHYGAVFDKMPTSGTAATRVIWLALLGAGIWVVLSRWSLAKLLVRQLNPFLTLFVVLAAVSVVWSIDPEVTTRRMVRVFTIWLDALALGLVAWRPHRLQTVLRPILTLVLVGSIVFVFASPEQSVEQSSQAELVGAWRGLATQKNGLGSIAGITLLLWIHAWLSYESRRTVATVGATIAAICLAGSRSSTSFMATAFAVLLLLLLLRSPVWLRRYMPYVVGIFLITLLVYSLTILQLVPGLEFLLSPITALTGKDLTFSGRTAIWQVVIEHIRKNPFWGSGYGAYWIGPVPWSPSYETVRRLYFYPTEAHSGYLDIINDLGALGGIVLVGYLIAYVRQALRLFTIDRAQGALYLCIFFEQLIANLSESRWLNVLCIEFVVMTLCTVTVARGLLDERLRQHAAGPPRRAW
ncbi:MAG: O-antigen ligase family protein [Pseudomonadota bacterium]|nr:O-antigen ligase family protein [Pseudomonadota bacterium]